MPKVWYCKVEIDKISASPGYCQTKSNKQEVSYYSE